MAAISNTAATPSRQPRLSTAVGRYRRWHVGTTAVPEDDIWMMTYLDVFTLMLVMMIVMLAFAGPGKGKEEAQAGNAGTPSATTTGPVPLAPPSAAPPTGSIVPPLVATAPEPPQPAPRSINGVPLDQLGGDVEVILNSDAVRFRISTELLFESGEAHFAAAGQPVLDKLIPMLNADPSLRLVVEGHTDSVPIQTERYPSNWELSTGRAAAVARYLIERGVAPQRVQASGFADTRPLGSRDNPVDRIHNRRVELTMERTPSTETKPR
jgi:chemotaxis protein MotB